MDHRSYILVGVLLGEEVPGYNFLNWPENAQVRQRVSEGTSSLGLTLVAAPRTGHLEI